MRRWRVLLFAGSLFLGAMARDAADRWIDATVLPPTLAETSVEVRGRDGNMLRVFTVENGIWRLRPHLSEVDPEFVRMLVRYEDKRFWSHAGVDPLAMLRAAGQAVGNGQVVSGGSTLTMQVARLLEDGSTGRWAGKLRQMRLALALERRLDKQEILTLYLTHAPYGGNLEGIRAATLAWFGKEPRRLTPAESAMLVALPQSPENRRPDRYPEQARIVRDRVLSRLRAHGVLAGSEAGSVVSVALPTRMQPFPRLAPHLADRVVADRPEARRHDLTLEPRVQAAMERLVGQAARQAGRNLSAALVAVDHRTGEIVASVGSPAYVAGDGRQGFVDMARAIRSPGSTLKPLIYGLAFDRGLVHPETLIHDGPVSFDTYAPRNFDGQFRGDIRIRAALQHSLNIPAVKLAQALGPARVMAALKRSGAEVQLPGGAPGLAIALGGVGISLHDLVQSYAALAQGGQGMLLRSGLSDAPRPGQRLMSDVASWQVGDILVGLSPPPGAPDRALAYKTGTSYGHRDTWAIGFDGRHVIGVWMGRADGTPVPGAFGGDLAAPVLFEAFGRLKPAFDPLPPPPPATLIVAAADLPEPLRRFRPQDARTAGPGQAPRLVFPPEGAVLSASEGYVPLKLAGGEAPFLVMANGVPVARQLRDAEFQVPSPGRGFSTFVIVDRNGLSDRVTVRLD